MLDQFTMKPASRKQRETQQIPDRIAATLDDIATALEAIAVELAKRR